MGEQPGGGQSADKRGARGGCDDGRKLALVLRVDGSVQMLPIGADGKVLVEGVELLSKDHPVWAGKAPDICHPDLPPAGG